jgi:hypothetical protein
MPECRKCRTRAVKWAKRAGKAYGERGAFVLLDDQPNPVGVYAIVDQRLVLWEPEHGPNNRWAPHEVFCEAEDRNPRRRAS